MYDYERFWRANHAVDAVIVALGVVLGLGIIPVSTQTTSSLTVLFVALLIIGGEVAIVISMAYRLIYFRDGIPMPIRPDMISPGWYGKVAWRYFTRFAKAITVSFTLGWALTVFFRAI